MTVTTKKAPDLSGNSVEGENQKTNQEEGELMNTTVAPEADNLEVKDTPVLIRRRTSYTREELAFAEREKTDRLETRYVLVDRPRHASFTTPDGESFRSAGSLYIRTCRDGVRRFTAYVHEESVHHDFRYLDRVINDAKFGRMDGWDRYTFKDGDEGWIFDYPNYGINRLNHFKPAQVLVEETSDTSGVIGYGSSWGYPCDEAQCREKYHEDEEVTHTLDSLTSELTSRAGYEIEICKDFTRPDSPWYLNLWTAEDLTELTPEQVTRFANDLNWMAIECKTTNAKEAAK